MHKFSKKKWPGIAEESYRAAVPVLSRNLRIYDRWVVYIGEFEMTFYIALFAFWSIFFAIFNVFHYFLDRKSFREISPCFR